LLLDRAMGLPMTLVPAPGTTVGRLDSPVFVVTLPQRGVEPGDLCVVVVADPTGNRLEASRIITAEDLLAGARMPFGARDFGMAATETPLAKVDAPVFLCGAALIRGDVTIARTAYAVVNIADDG
jgi:hypothetical protein